MNAHEVWKVLPNLPLEWGGELSYRVRHGFLVAVPVEGRSHERDPGSGGGSRWDVVVVRAIRGLLAACLVLLASGCTALTGDQATGELQELSCEMNIDRAEALPADYRSLLGAVGLPTADVRAEVIEPAWWGDRGVLTYNSKFGLFVQPGAEFTLRLRHSPRTALMGWRTGAHETYSTLRSGGCAGADWKVYAGGIWVAEPMCVELLVETREASEVVELEVGEDCR